MDMEENEKNYFEKGWAISDTYGRITHEDNVYYDFRVLENNDIWGQIEIRDLNVLGESSIANPIIFDNVP